MIIRKKKRRQDEEVVLGPDALLGTSFDPNAVEEDDAREVKPNIILSIEGDDKTGKSHLACTAPGKIAYLSIDFGVDRVIRKFPKKKIKVVSYTYEKPEFNKDNARDKDRWEREGEEIREGVYAKFLRDFYGVVRSGLYRTIVEDTSTDVWEMFRLAHFGKLQQNPQLAYGPVNKAFKAHIQAAKSAGINLILLHQIGPLYKETINSKGVKVSTKVEGQTKRIGMSKIGFLVDSYVQSRRVRPKTKKVGDKIIVKGEAGWAVDILTCGHNPEVEGMTLDNPTFQDIATLCKPEVDADLWD